MRFTTPTTRRRRWRYTEVRLSRLAEKMIREDIDRETVAWAPNYDGSGSEPAVLPARVPNLLVNGAEAQPAESHRRNRPGAAVPQQQAVLQLCWQVAAGLQVTSVTQLASQVTWPREIPPSTL